MRSEVIKADTIDAAAKRILDELKEDATETRISKNGNTIYFDGWDGLGATAVFETIAQRLGTPSEAPAGLRFDQIVHIDCTKWENRRAMQRVIANQLGLSAAVMEMFDRQDEEDDFNGVELDSRSEIEGVLAAMHRRIKELNHRFLVIFHNGSSKEIDIASFGFPLSRYLNNKVLWTFQGRFRLYPRMKVDAALEGSETTEIFISASCQHKDAPDLGAFLVRQEAEEVASKINTDGAVVQDSQVAECFLYMLKLCCTGFDFMLDLATHGTNYWLCDGIIRLQNGEGDDNDESWRAGDALQLEMQLDADYYLYKNPYFPSHLVYWTSPTNEFPFIPAGAIPNGDMFQNFRKLRTLKLLRRTFSISSPPFLYCHNLKFLWLDHCQEIRSSTDEATGEEDDFRHFFHGLWVLDVRHTKCISILSTHMMDLMTQLRELNVMGAQDWDIGQLQGRFPNIRKLRVTKSTISCGRNSSEDGLFSGMKRMELLDFSGNRITGGMTSLSMAANNKHHLETILIDDGCVGLEQISFRGCAKVKNVLLRGLFPQLDSLDMSDTAVKIVDLRAMTAEKLDQLLLLHCNKLCAILWPPSDKRKKYVSTLCIDTTEWGSTSAAAGSSPSVVKLDASQFNWYLSLRDSRILQSIVPMGHYFDGHYAHVEISTPTSRSVMHFGGTTVERNKSGIGTKQQVPVNLPKTEQRPEAGNALIYDQEASAILKNHVLQESNPSIAQIWPCPSAPQSWSTKCSIYIQDEPMRTKLSLGSTELTSITATIRIPSFICDRTRILHVHDSVSITSIPVDANWHALDWCRVERCPRLGCLFAAPTSSASTTSLGCLRTLWASQLLKAQFIWNWNRPSIFRPSIFGSSSCEDLRFLHVDFCPRLIHVHPFSMPRINNGGSLLETLQIMWCGDLRVVFPLQADTKSHHQQQQHSVTVFPFPHLRHIHLHELPKLQGICGSGKMYAPSLESIKIRGCWSLTRLPSVLGGYYRKKVECDCEKEWWERLVWDGLDASHHPSLYKPIHPRYYKKTMLRGSLLR